MPSAILLVYDTPRRPASPSSRCYPRATGGVLIRLISKLEGTPAATQAGFFIAIRMDLDFGKSDGLITAVIQDYGSGRVLMVGYMNEEAFRQTVETGYATFYSRSRKKLWQKGETSGHRLIVKEISTDCD